MPAARTIRLLFTSSLLGLAACSRAPDPLPAPGGAAGDDTFSVMTYNLGHYGYLDRDGDGQVNDFKPASACAAIQALIVEKRPDILLVQQVGDLTVFEQLKQHLAKQGLVYDHADWMEASRGEFNLGLFSRFPPAGINHHSPTHRIRGQSEPVQCGFQEVQLAVSPNRVLRVVNTHFTSKEFHPLGQNEMRRNESRLLGNRVEEWSGDGTRKEPEFLIAGCLNDDPGSVTLRNLLVPRTATRLVNLNFPDTVGDRWTYVEPEEDRYTRRDYILASPGLVSRLVAEKSGVVRDARTYSGSPHRPVVAVFR